MDSIIDFQTSEQMKQFSVLPGVDSDLDKSKLKISIEFINSFIFYWSFNFFIFFQ